MRNVFLFTLLGGIALAVPAHAQRGGNPGGSSDPCLMEADRLYGHMRNLDERQRVKRQHIAQCRAAAGGKRR